VLGKGTRGAEGSQKGDACWRVGGDLDSTSLSIACDLVPRALLGGVVRSGRAAVELLTLRRSWAFLASSASPRLVLSIKSGLPHESPRPLQGDRDGPLVWMPLLQLLVCLAMLWCGGWRGRERQR
jgi:hypothetical protein